MLPHLDVLDRTHGRVFTSPAKNRFLECIPRHFLGEQDTVIRLRAVERAATQLHVRVAECHDGIVRCRRIVPLLLCVLTRVDLDPKQRIQIGKYRNYRLYCNENQAPWR